MKKKHNKSNLVVKGFLKYLSQEGQIQLLEDVVSELGDHLEETKKSKVIIITSSISLTSSQLTDLKNILRKLLNTDLPIVSTVDKKLIAGFTIRVGDWFLNASLLYQMNSLKRVLLS